MSLLLSQLGGTTYNETLSEAASAADALLTALLAAEGQAEASSALETLTNQVIAGGALGELAAADDGDTTSVISFAELLEQAAAADALSAEGGTSAQAGPRGGGIPVLLFEIPQRQVETHHEQLGEHALALDRWQASVVVGAGLQARADAGEALAAQLDAREALSEAAEAQARTSAQLAAHEVQREFSRAHGTYTARDVAVILEAALQKRERRLLEREREALHEDLVRFLEHLAHQVANAVGKMMKAGDEDKDPVTGADWDGLEESARVRLGAVARDAARNGLEQVGADVGQLLQQANKRAIAWAADHAGELIRGVRKTTRQAVRDLTALALEEGWSNDELAAELRGDDAFSASRADRIARTETAAADVQGNVIGWKESGLVTGKEWKVADAGECEACSELDGEVVAIDGEFPGGVSGPPLHPNCRCDVLPVMADADEGGAGGGGGEPPGGGGGDGGSGGNGGGGDEPPRGGRKPPAPPWVDPKGPRRPPGALTGHIRSLNKNEHGLFSDLVAEGNYFEARRMTSKAKAVRGPEGWISTSPNPPHDEAHAVEAKRVSPEAADPARSAFSSVARSLLKGQARNIVVDGRASSLTRAQAEDVAGRIRVWSAQRRAEGKPTGLLWYLRILWPGDSKTFEGF